MVLTLLLGSVAGWGATLQAAVGKVDITPPPGIRLWGYSDRDSPATGTLDPLYARVLVLEAGGQKFALVSIDLGRSFGPASLEQLRNATRNDVSFLIVTATHTHSGPEIRDEYSGGPPAWETAALEKIASTIAEACKHLRSAQIGAGYGSAFIGHNRLRVNWNGSVSWFERNVTQVPTAPVDGTVSVLRVDSTDGRPLAIIVDYACHPVVFGSDNLHYSADFPAVMARTVEDAFEEKPLCFFLQGAAGDINPYYAVTPIEQDAIGMRDRTGHILGHEAMRIAKEIHTHADAQPELQFAEDVLSARLRWNPDKWREAMTAVFGSRGSEPFTPRLEEIRLPVTTVLINRKIALLSMPGEPFVEYQITWRQRCPVPDAFLIGYANGYSGYFPATRSATLGGYGATNPATWVEIGAGDRMVDAGVIRINQMLGRLHELPEDLLK
ncbi:MAG TPA: neutral/alkaline non-lysosomal ceramidase N-terminal domain-containing protein [Terriglobales bacterium]|nr:neutral/alkaline non-lysosomal ceramidase N-terminal domain-containing protein [Terriglobales bacterium]